MWLFEHYYKDPSDNTVKNMYLFQDREFVESDQAFNGAPNRPSNTPPLTPTPSITSIENRHSGCCARRQANRRFRVRSDLSSACCYEIMNSYMLQDSFWFNLSPLFIWEFVFVLF